MSWDFSTESVDPANPLTIETLQELVGDVRDMQHSGGMVMMNPQLVGELPVEEVGVRVVTSTFIPNDIAIILQEQYGGYAKFVRKTLEEMDYFGWRTGGRFTTTPRDWPRLRYESLIEWGKYLVRSGHMDDPNIRWEYQKAVFQAILDKIGNLVRRLL